MRKWRRRWVSVCVSPVQPRRQSVTCRESLSHWGGGVLAGRTHSCVMRAAAVWRSKKKKNQLGEEDCFEKVKVDSWAVWEVRQRREKSAVPERNRRVPRPLPWSPRFAEFFGEACFVGYRLATLHALTWSRVSIYLSIEIACSGDYSAILQYSMQCACRLYRATYAGVQGPGNPRTLVVPTRRSVGQSVPTSCKLSRQKFWSVTSRLVRGLFLILQRNFDCWCLIVESSIKCSGGRNNSPRLGSFLPQIFDHIYCCYCNEL